MNDDPRAGAGRRGPDAYPETELLVGPEGAQVRCPYCDTVSYLHGPHKCSECGAKFEVNVRWFL